MMILHIMNSKIAFLKNYYQMMKRLLKEYKEEIHFRCKFLKEKKIVLK